MADAEIQETLTVCGIGPQAVRDQMIENEGFLSLADLGVMEGDKDVLEMSKRMASRTVQDGRVTLGTVQIKRLQALVWWVRDHQRRGLELVAADFNVAARDAAMISKSVEKERGDSDVSIKDLSKFEPDDFDLHEDAFLNLLAQTQGAVKESIRYIVRAQVTPEDFVDTREERMYQLALVGPGYEEDNRAVFRLLKSYLINTAGWAWIEPMNSTENGRVAFWAWSNHYNGQGELSKRTSLSKARVESLHYKNEQSMSFEKYTELLTKCFTTLDKDPDERVSARQKVERLLKGINTPDTELQACKAVISQNYRADFAGACAYFSQEVARLHGGAQLENRKQRKRRVSEVSSGRGRSGRGRFGGRGRGRYGERGGRSGRGARGQSSSQGRGNGTIINGIDVTDPTRTFEDHEWESLGYNGGRAYVMQARERINGRGRGRDTGRGRGQRNASATSSTEHTGSSVAAEETDTTAGTGRGNGERGGRNGRGFGRNAYRS